MTLTTRAPRPRTQAREVPGKANLPAYWRAALTVLAEAFARDEAVWACVSPGDALDLRPVIYDRARSDADRVLLVFAEGLVNDPMMLPLDRLLALDDRRLRVFLDALAIARGGLPID